LNRYRLSRALKIMLGLAVLLELLAPITSDSWGVDGPEMLKVIGQFSRLFSAGVLLPNWSPEAFYGFGAATFAFYPPISFIPAGILHGLFHITSEPVLFKLTGAIATLASLWTCFVLLRYLGADKPRAWLGGLLFAFGPFRIAELYNRSGISSHVAYAFLPLVCYTLIALVREHKAWSQWVPLFAVCVAAIALTNVPLTIIIAFAILLAGVVCWRLVTWPIIAAIGSATFLAAMLIAFHFSSAIAFAGATHAENILGTPQTLVLSVIEGGNLPTAYHAALLYACVAVILTSYYLAKRSASDVTSQEQMTVRLAIGIIVFTLLLETPYVNPPIWHLSPIVQWTVGAQRYYILLLLFVVLMIGVATTPQLANAARISTWILAAGAIGPALLVACNIHVFQHSASLPHDPAEYLPIAVPDKQPDLLGPYEHDAAANADLSTDESIKPALLSSDRERYAVTFIRPHRVTFHRFQWPSWHLSVHGSEIASIADLLGRTTAELPAGTYEAVWEYKHNPVEIAGRLISLLAVSLLIAVYGVQRVLRTRKGGRSASLA
jgi:hypothetical protein